MEEKERYELFGEHCIKDNNPDARCQLLSAYVACVILNEQDKENQQLKQQLAEKTLAIEQINKAFIENRSLWKGKYEQSNQDKISFAVKQLEKLKEKLLEELQNVTDLLDPLEYEDYHEFIGCGRGYKNSIEEIDNQINELKGNVKDE